MTELTATPTNLTVSSDALRNTLDFGCQILESNKKVVTPELLNTLEQLINIFKSFDNTSLAVLKTLDPNNGISGATPIDDMLKFVVNALTEIIAIERKLVETTLTDDMIGIMQGIRKRNLLLAIIARIL